MRSKLDLMRDGLRISAQKKLAAARANHRAIAAGQNLREVPRRNAGITPRFASRKMLTTKTDRISATCGAASALLKLEI